MASEQDWYDEVVARQPEPLRAALRAVEENGPAPWGGARRVAIQSWDRGRKPRGRVGACGSREVVGPRGTRVRRL